MTRKIINAAVFSLALSAAAFAQTGIAPATQTAAPLSGPTKIGVINIQAAIVNTNEGKRDFDALQKKFEPKQAELKALNDEIDNLKKQLDAQGTKMTEEDRAARVRVIEQKQKNLQRALEDAQNDFQAQQSEVANRIGQKLVDVLDKYAKTNGLSLVVDASTQSSPVLWAAEQVNITPAIVDAYNAQSGVAAPPAGTRPATGPAAATRPGTPPVKKPVTPGTKPQ
jgi:outer membrane protein